MRFFILPIVVLMTLVLAIAAVRVSAAPFVNPVTPVPGGLVSPFLNTSSTAQTKLGGLTVQDLVVGVVGNDPGDDDLKVGRTGGSSKICWNGVCKNSWDEVVQLTGKLRLRPASGYDTGAIQLKGLDCVAGSLNCPSDPPATVITRAGKPSTSPTHGIYGRANGGAAGTASYGIYGRAAADSHYAVYATNSGNIYAWAAYFEGDVAVTTKVDGTPSDLYIGVNTMNNDNVAQLCLNGDCRSSWASIGSSGFWSLNGSYLYPTAVTRSLGVGGAAPNAPFSVAVTADANNLPQQADLSVRADSQFNQYVVGTPPASLPVSVTCGDGQCNGSENDTYGSANYCPADCDATAPGNISFILVIQNDSTLERTWTWAYPVDADVAGVRIVRKQGSPPTGPTDGTFLTFVNSPGSTYTGTNHALDVGYFYGFYTYDGRYYSSGVIEYVIFHSGGGGGGGGGEDGGGGEIRR